MIIILQERSNDVVGTLWATVATNEDDVVEDSDTGDIYWNSGFEFEKVPIITSATKIGLVARIKVRDCLIHTCKLNTKPLVLLRGQFTLLY